MKLKIFYNECIKQKFDSDSHILAVIDMLPS